MRNKPIILLLLAMIASLNYVYAQRLNGALRPLKSLIGSWEMKSGEGRIIEVWRYESPIKISGKSFRIGLNNDSTLLEEADIVKKNGRLFFIPIVAGQNEGQSVEFGLKSRTRRQYIFENKEHDFPQRVGYHLQSSDDLLAWIEGSKNGKDQRSEFRYRRSGKR